MEGFGVWVSAAGRNGCLQPLRNGGAEAGFPIGWGKLWERGTPELHGVSIGRALEHGGKFVRIINGEEIIRRKAELLERGRAGGDDGSAHGGRFDDGVSEAFIRAGADDEFGEFVE